MQTELQTLQSEHERIGDSYLAECRRRALAPLVVAWHSPIGKRAPVTAYLFFDYENSPDGEPFEAPNAALLVLLVVDAVERVRCAGRN